MHPGEVVVRGLGIGREAGLSRIVLLEASMAVTTWQEPGNLMARRAWGVRVVRTVTGPGLC